MIRNKFFIITAFSIILLTNFGLTAAFSQPMIEQIMFDSPAADEDRLIFKLNGPHLPKTFALKGERPRVVFDFPDVVPGKKVQNTIQADGNFIQRIRTGIHRGENPRTRIVLDLQPDMKIDFAQSFESDSNILTISIYAEGMPPEPAAAMEEKPAPAEMEAVPPEPALEEPAAPAEKISAEKPEAEKTLTAAAPSEAPDTMAGKPETETQPAQEMQIGEQVPTPAPPQAQVKQPESPAKPELEESTVIQPLSEIGEKGQQAKEEVAFPTLHAVEFDNTSHRGEIVAFKLNGFNPPVVFGIEEDIPRIVCFFKDTSAGENLGELIEANGRFIQNIKIGKYRNPDNVRVVLDLIPGKNYDLQQIFFKEDNLFMVIINTTGDKVVN